MESVSVSYKPTTEASKMHVPSSTLSHIRNSFPPWRQNTLAKHFTVTLLGDIFLKSVDNSGHKHINVN